MNTMQIEMLYRSTWAYLTFGSPSLIVILCAVNAVFVAFFLFARGYFNPLNYHSKIRQRIHVTMALANIAALLHRDLLPIMGEALRPFGGLLHMVI